MEELLVPSTASSQLPGRLLALALHAQDQNCTLCCAGKGTRRAVEATQCCLTWHDLSTLRAEGVTYTLRRDGQGHVTVIVLVSEECRACPPAGGELPAPKGEAKATV